MLFVFESCKFFLRNSMTQERISALDYVWTEKEILVNLQTWVDELIDWFAKKKIVKRFCCTDNNSSIYILYTHVIQSLLISWPPQISNPPSATVFVIVKTEWMILETVPAEIPSSWAIRTLTRRSCKIMSSIFWHISFEDASTGRLNVNSLQSIPYPT